MDLFKRVGKTFMKYFFSIFLVFITICYFGVGIFNTYNFGLTVDEYAHIGATQSNSRGIANNGEHPILLKSINAILLKLKYSNFTPTEAEQYKLGNQFLLESRYQGLDILRNSRLIYLVFNFIPILILSILSVRKLLSQKVVVWFSLFYVFSVTFISNANLITFDIAGSWTTLIFILVNWIIFKKYLTVSQWDQFFLSSLSMVAFCLALNTKYSNILLLPILFICNILAIIFAINNRDKKFFLYYFFTSIASLLFFYISIFGLYRFSFGNSQFVFVRHTVLDKNLLFNKYFDILEQSTNYSNFIQEILKPLKWYMNGLGSVLLRSAEPSYTSFFLKENINKTFLQYNLGLLPFKENPLIMFGAIASIPLIVRQVLKAIKNYKWNSQSFINNSILTIIFVIFPVIYLLISKDSKLTIGYRHFAPVIIFIYFGLAIVFTNHFSKWMSIIIATLIILSGTLGMSQNLSYTNFLWQEPKWLLANDSSYNWGQENYRANKYVYDNYYSDLLSAKSRDVVASSFGTFNFGLELRLIDKNFYNPNLNTENLDSKYFTENLIDDRPNYKSHSKIIIIDSQVIQKLFLCQVINPICQSNFQFFKNTKPHYSSNQVIFVYRLS